MFKNILIVATIIVVANSGGCSTTPTTTPTPVTVKKDSFLQELALANPQLLEEQAGDQMVSDWNRLRREVIIKCAARYPEGWSTQGEEGLSLYENWRSESLKELGQVFQLRD